MAVVETKCTNEMNVLNYYIFQRLKTITISNENQKNGNLVLSFDVLQLARVLEK